MSYSYLIIICYFISDQAFYNSSNCESSYDVFIIKTEGCNITNISEEREIIKAMSGPPEIENCDKENQLLDSNATHIWILKDMFTNFNISDENSLSCCYMNFSAYNNIKNILYSTCKQFLTVIKAEHEFVRVDCSYKDSTIYSDYFVFIIGEARPKRPILESAYNVIILGLESLSRLNFERTMPKTAKFLKDRGAVQLKGYNKVGYNSFPNLFPLLTGRSFNSCETLQCSFIWELYRNAGYYTALGSDSVVGAMGSYEYSWPTIPTDYYLQPFMAEANNIISHHVNVYDRRCLKNKAFYKIVLNYIKGLLQYLSHNKDKLFGFFWEESVSHNILKKPQIMDEGYLNFFTELESNQLLDDTILIVLGDHGMRWGRFAKTQQGRLEGNLPLFSILVPTSFRETYKDAYTNFQVNSNRLTTPYDAYRTIVDLVNPKLLKNHHLKISLKENKSNGIYHSLFLPVSANRSCMSIGIDKAWCACDLSTAEPIQKREIVIAATVILNRINKMLADFPKCQTLTLRNIVGNANMKAVSIRERTYKVILEATPGGGIFQGMAGRQRSQWVAFGPIMRLNKYAKETSCMESGLIKLYCVCN
ncbi:uncharacterized protein LOC133517983 [Cydia pomonella]|uniref:uncharacterized protein LOC133517983 n=1 Tax=Cydia pomonella TaxID=82600 RepID=UPI002ADDA38B|nr:uncharacterized protein LOC133517983 [Cydia pomonella]